MSVSSRLFQYSWRGALLIISALNLNVVVCGCLQVPPSYWTRRHSNHSKDVELTINDKKAEADGEESSADGVAVDDGGSLDGDNAPSGSSKSLAILRQILRDGLDFSLLT